MAHRPHRTEFPVSRTTTVRADDPFLHDPDIDRVIVPFRERVPSSGPDDLYSELVLSGPLEVLRTKFQDALDYLDWVAGCRSRRDERLTA